MSEFTVYPAIDLRNGEVVRLKQGDPKAQKTYSSDPGKVAETWSDAGASWLHVINLDGAFDENVQANQEALETILLSIGEGVQIQLGGGIRNLRGIEKALQAGVGRVIVGTAALENPDFAKEAIRKFGSSLVAFAVDAKKGVLKTHGWKKSSKQSTGGYATCLAESGARILIYTDIAKDGMGVGVDWQTARQLAVDTGLQVIAAGGVATLQDVKDAKAAGINGVIIGRALYENQINLQEALAC